MTTVFVVIPVVMFVVVFVLTLVIALCLKRRKVVQTQDGRNQPVQTRSHPYLNTTTPVHNYQQQAQHGTSGTPAGYQYHPDDTTTAQLDFSTSSLQEAPPPPYEAAKNYSPPSSSAAIAPTAPQPFPPLVSNLPPDNENPPQYHKV